MAQLVVRNIENEVKVKLQRRARRNGRSMEEEVREILRDAAKNEGAAREIILADGRSYIIGPKGNEPDANR